MSPDSLPSGVHPDASLRLIAQLSRAEEDAYLAATRRRIASGQTPSWGFRVLTALVTLVIGAVLTVSALSLRRSPASGSPQKDALVERIIERRSASDQAADRIALLRDEVRALEAGPLGEAGLSSVTERIDALEVGIGAVAVTGPGMRITLDDAADAQLVEPGAGEGGQPDQGAVLARDVQQVVNALWAAGAEAVAVNGHRLMPTTAIRFAGRAIIVGFRPLTRPYLITAVGPADIPQRFAAGVGGAYLDGLRRGYGIRADTAAENSVTVPGGPVIPPRYATPTGTGSPERSPESSGTSGPNRATTGRSP